MRDFFERGEEVPDAPALISAYGERASEISNDQRINPTGQQDRDGFFSEHVGIDRASIWAAATSGKGALGVHLLDCLLARMWSGPEATAIWTELVEARKKALEINAKSSAAGGFQMLFASQVKISRTELATWDASARA